MGTLSELAALGKPTMVVPMPGVAPGGERAGVLARRAGCWCSDQDSLSPELLWSTIRDLLADVDRREALGAAIRQVMPLDAAARIAEDVVSLVRSPARRA